MPLFQEVWSFRGNSGAKWNEVHFCVQPDLAAAANFTPAFINSRLALLHVTCTWVKVRITQVTDPTIHTLVTINKAGHDGPADNPANPGEACVVNLASSVRAGSRKLWMRGLAESSVTFNAVTGQSEINPAFDALLKQFIQKLGPTQANYAVKKRKKGENFNIVKTRVTRVDGTIASGRARLFCVKDPKLAVGDMVQITRAEPKLFPGLTGPFKVLAFEGFNFDVQYTVPQEENILSETTLAEKLVYWEDAIINPAISGFLYGGVRRTKNDSTGSRGARSALKLRN